MCRLLHAGIEALFIRHLLGSLPARACSMGPRRLEFAEKPNDGSFRLKPEATTSTADPRRDRSYERAPRVKTDVERAERTRLIKPSGRAQRTGVNRSAVLLSH